LEDHSWMRQISPKRLPERLAQSIAMRLVIDVPKPHVALVFAEVQKFDLQAFDVAIAEDDIQTPLMALPPRRGYCRIRNSFPGEVAIGFVNIKRKRRLNVKAAVVAFPDGDHLAEDPNRISLH